MMVPFLVCIRRLLTDAIVVDDGRIGNSLEKINGKTMFEQRNLQRRQLALCET
jgi:hypothetical protein